MSYVLHSDFAPLTSLTSQANGVHASLHLTPNTSSPLKGGGLSPELGRNPVRSSHAGFTLIEILIVLVIVGITIALISVNFRRNDKAEVRDQAERLALLLQAARTEAISTGKSLAWIGNASTYGFFTRDEDRRWTVAFTDPPLTGGHLTPPISLIDVQINGARTPIATPLVFSSSGLNARFKLELGTAETRMLVIGESGGNIHVKDESATTE
ncbi:MAG TPA: GspH/FimT family pseudopilin [Burkholderiales bacterium]|nr:GspH/FimT family pseudopilin [Burkholderiales bacterium]